MALCLVFQRPISHAFMLSGTRGWVGGVRNTMSGCRVCHSIAPLGA